MLNLLSITFSVLLACPGSGAALVIDDLNRGETPILTCDPEACQEIINRVSAGETVVARERDGQEQPYLEIQLSSPSPERFVVLQQWQTGETEMFVGEIAIDESYRQRGGCASEVEFVSRLMLKRN